MFSRALTTFCLTVVLYWSSGSLAQPLNIWQRYYSATDQSGDWLFDVYQTADGGYAMCGKTTYHLGLEEPINPFWVVRTNGDGELEWERDYPEEGVRSWNCWAFSIIETDDGGFLIGGRRSTAEMVGAYFHLMKIDEDGDVLWRSDYGGKGECFGVIELKSGDYLAVGWAGVNHEAYIVMVNEEGAKIRDTTYAGERFTGVREIPGDGFILSGWKPGGWVLKVDENLEEVWSRVYDDAYFNAITSCGNSEYAVAGDIYTVEDGNGEIEFCTAKLDTDGNELWYHTYEFDDDEEERGGDTRAWSLAKMEDGGLVVVGYKDWNIPRILRTDSGGNEMWHRVDYVGSVGEYNSVIVNQEGEIVIAGKATRDGSVDGLLTKIGDFVPPHMIIGYNPTELELSCLPDDSISFSVYAQTWRPDGLTFIWTLDGDSVGSDTFATFTFPDLGDYSVRCKVSDGTDADSVSWAVHAVEMFITEWQPDTLDLLIQRNHAVDFSVMVRATPDPSPIEYQWLVDGAGVSEDTATTVTFYESGDHAVEAAANRNDVWDVVTWQVLVRSLIGWEEPDHRDTLTVNLGDTAIFRAFPFNPDDTLNYHWAFDRRSAGDADSAVIVFGTAGLHQLVAVAWKDDERDRIEWTVNVIDPRGIIDCRLQIADCRLSEPYPNPFNATAVIGYRVSVVSEASLGLYELNGRLVQTLVDGWQTAGEHQALIDGTQLPSGIYLLRLSSGDQVALRKVCLIK